MINECNYYDSTNIIKSESEITNSDLYLKNINKAKLVIDSIMFIINKI